jgi:hypothetical protein
MADSGGHWANLAEAQKLTQDTLVPGFIEEDIKLGGLASMLPVWQLNGTNLVWNREKVVGAAQRASVGSQLVWTDEFEYNQITRPLKIAYKQTPLNKFVEQTYGTFNNYAAIQNRELSKSVLRTINDDLIYGDTTNGGSLQPLGLHAMASLYPTSLNGESNDVNIDSAESALSLGELRKLIDNMKYGVDFLYFPKVIARRLDAYVQEAGVANTIGTFNFTKEEIGARVTAFEGVPIVRTDYLVEETVTAASGTPPPSTELRTKSAGTGNYSIFAIKAGQVAFEEPGLTFVFGGDTNEQGQLMRTEFFPQLENFDASGLRKTSYYNLADGSIMAVGRISDVDDAVVTV